jgi:hypothetical protein
MQRIQLAHCPLPSTSPCAIAAAHAPVTTSHAACGHLARPLPAACATSPCPCHRMRLLALPVAAAHAPLRGHLACPFLTARTTSPCPYHRTRRVTAPRRRMCHIVLPSSPHASRHHAPYRRTCTLPCPCHACVASLHSCLALLLAHNKQVVGFPCGCCRRYRGRSRPWGTRCACRVATGLEWITMAVGAYHAPVQLEWIRSCHCSLHAWRATATVCCVRAACHCVCAGARALGWRERCRVRPHPGPQEAAVAVRRHDVMCNMVWRARRCCAWRDAACATLPCGAMRLRRGVLEMLPRVEQGWWRAGRRC